MSVISTKDKNNTIAVAEGGQEVTGEMIDKWCKAYDAGHFPDGYVPCEISQGRPPLYGEKMSTVTIRIPEVQKTALEYEASTSGISLSSYIRNIIALR